MADSGVSCSVSLIWSELLHPKHSQIDHNAPMDCEQAYCFT